MLVSSRTGQKLRRPFGDALLLHMDVSAGLRLINILFLQNQDEGFFRPFHLPRIRIPNRKKPANPPARAARKVAGSHHP